MFDAAKFERTAFEPRTKSVPVPDLKHFFSEGSEPEWIVRSMTGNELARCLGAEARQKAAGKVLQEISSAGAGVDEARKALGLIEKATHGEIAKRLEMLSIASVDPPMTLPLAVRLAENFPIEFYQLTNAINELTGQGADFAKPEAALLEMTG